MNEDQMSPKLEAQFAHDFLESRIGKHFIVKLSLQYNALHQAAESESLTSEQKAMKVERAAGVKYAIDWFTAKDGLLQSGYFGKDEEKPAEQ